MILDLFEGGIIETRGLIGEGGLFNLVKMVVSVFHKDLECKVEKLKYKKLKVMQWGSKTKYPTFQHVNKQSRISPNEVLQSWLINTVYHLLVKNNKGEERGGGLKEKRGLLTFFAWKEGGGLIWESGLNRGFTIGVIAKRKCEWALKQIPVACHQRTLEKIVQLN